MKLEVGKKYKNKLGEIVKSIIYDEERYFCFYDERETNCTYEWVYIHFDKDRHYNLVEEV